MYAMQYPLTYLHVLAHKYCTYKMGLEQMFEKGNHENYFIMVLSILYTFPRNIQEHIRKTYQYLYNLSRFSLKVQNCYQLIDKVLYLLILFPRPVN